MLLNQHEQEGQVEAEFNDRAAGEVHEIANKERELNFLNTEWTMKNLLWWLFINLCW